MKKWSVRLIAMKKLMDVSAPALAEEHIKLETEKMKYKTNKAWRKPDISAGAIFSSIALLILFLLSGCASQAYRFADAEPVTQYNDMHPVPVPEATKYERAFYETDALVRRPAVRALKISKSHPAKDVNSLDEAPASSWFTPRLGYQTLSREELLHGVEQVGPPQFPIKVTKAKTGGNPGFFIKDARGKLYMVKFDPPEFPAIETATALIVNRLFWGFGYNVPEDYLLYFDEDDLRIDPSGKITREDVQAVLRRVAPPVNGRYRATASLFLTGEILGPIPEAAVREDDRNDKIPHEDRRVLRALRVFSAFTNHSDLRIDNTLDVYTGEPGSGYVKHYLLDFGEAFGGHGAEHDYLWDGFRHIFSFGEMFKNLATFGFHIQDWEHIEYTRWKSVGAFEAKIFEPETWKEVYPFEPIRRSQPADDYWAVKIVGALTRAHLKTLVEAAGYPEAGAAEYMLETLMARRKKVLEYFLNRVSPVDAAGFHDGELLLKDMGNILLKKNGSQTRYEIRFYNDSGKEIADKQTVLGGGNRFGIPVSDALLKKADGYLRIDVWVWRGNQKAPSPAQFHIRAQSASPPRLVGVVH